MHTIGAISPYSDSSPRILGGAVRFDKTLRYNDNLQHMWNQLLTAYLPELLWNN